jgi:hypothetical protein
VEWHRAAEIGRGGDNGHVIVDDAWQTVAGCSDDSGLGGGMFVDVVLRPEHLFQLADRDVERNPISRR